MQLDPALQAVMGKIMPPEHYRAKYELDECLFVGDVADFVGRRDPDVLYVLSGHNDDSGLPAPEATFPGIGRHRVDRGKLRHELAECRVIKSERELEVMRYVSGVTAEAHKAVMRACRPGMMEYQLEATFLYHIYFHGGCRTSGYTPICAAGPRCATLHYGHAGAPNNMPINDGDMCLIDCGAEYYCYDGDITRSFPANGKFTQDQRDIYETVLAAMDAVEAAMKPGVLWPDMHRLAFRVTAQELVKRGFLQGDVEEILAKHLIALFMPHGLGHLIGLDTHDVGGYPRGGNKRATEPGIKKLRTARALAPNMCVTVEPGCYFNSFLLEPAMADPATAHLFVQEKVKRFMGFGGVRIEDDVRITETGIEILNPGLPRTCDEIEAFMAH